ncbi:MAG: RNA 2',3'-cyclic phosphodiesterase [Bacillota bacterium]
MLRLFIALELSDQQKNEIDDFQEKAKKHLKNVRWVKPGNIHLTLKFLGETDESRVDLIKAAIDDACDNFSSFPVNYGDGGVFPSEKKARVLWVGQIKGSEIVCGLAEKLQEKMAGLGYEKEKRTFHPHLTIGRLRNPPPPSSIQKFLSAGKDFTSSESTINQVVLFESKLLGSGAIHNPMYKKELY